MSFFMGRDKCLLGKERKDIFGAKSQLWKCRNLFLKLSCVASVMCWELLAKMTVITPYTRINSKQIQCLNIEPKTIKESIRGKLQDIGFLRYDTKTTSKKRKHR